MPDPVSASIIGSAAIGGAASIFGGNQAAKAQQAAAQAAIAAQERMFDKASGNLAPYYKAGASEIPLLQSFIDPNNPNSPLATLLKLTTPGADMSATLEQTPGFQFASQYGQKATRNALAARGLAGPGGALSRGIADYTTGLAGNTWKDVVNSLLGTFQAGTVPMQNLINTGAGAASSLAGAATQTGAQIGNTMLGLGNAQAANAMNTANAIGGIGSSVGNAAILQKLLGSQGGSGDLYNTGNIGGTGGNLGGWF